MKQVVRYMPYDWVFIDQTATRLTTEDLVYLENCEKAATPIYITHAMLEDNGFVPSEMPGDIIRFVRKSHWGDCVILYSKNDKYYCLQALSKSIKLTTVWQLQHALSVAGHDGIAILWKVTNETIYKEQ